MPVIGFTGSIRYSKWASAVNDLEAQGAPVAVETGTNFKTAAAGPPADHIKISEFSTSVYVIGHVRHTDGCRMSPTEVGRMCREYPDQILRMYGDFVIVDVTRAPERIDVYRSFSGARSLFVQRINGGVAYSTHVMLLGRLIGTKSLNSEYLGNVAVFGYSDGDACLLPGVVQVPRGHTELLAWTPIGPRSDPMSSRRRALQPPRPASLRGPIEEVAKALPNDEDFTILMSGGVDSAAIACAVATQGRAADATAVTFVAANDSIRTSLAEQLSKELGMRWVPVEVQFGGLDVVLAPALLAGWLAPELYVAMSELREADVPRTVLVGTGGDVLFGGNPNHRDPRGSVTALRRRAGDSGRPGTALAAELDAIERGSAADGDPWCTLRNLLSFEKKYESPEVDALPLAYAAAYWDIDVQFPYLDWRVSAAADAIPIRRRVGTAGKQYLRDYLSGQPYAGANRIAAMPKDEGLPGAVKTVLVERAAWAKNFGRSYDLRRSEFPTTFNTTDRAWWTACKLALTDKNLG